MSDNLDDPVCGHWVHWVFMGIIVLIVILGAAGGWSNSGSGQDMCETGEYSPSGMAIMEPC